jgi:hypothetical protein
MAASNFDFSGFSDPVPLARRQQGAPSRPGAYIITCGHCVPHIGTSKSIQARVRTLASLGNHRGSAEVLCAAYCTGEPPMVRWIETDSDTDARVIEQTLKRQGEPPRPRPEFDCCVNGNALRVALVAAAGSASWEAGYIDALFDVGEQLKRLESSHFDAVWKEVGWPPGPWAR